MKKVFAVLFWCFASLAYAQQWTTDGDDIINTNSGDIKIGNSAVAQARIYFRSSSSGNGFLYSPTENSSNIGRYFLRFDMTNNGSFPYLTNRTPNGKVVIKTGTATGGAENTHFTIEGGNGVVDSYFENTNLGIGTASPLHALDVRGNIGVGEIAYGGTGTSGLIMGAKGWIGIGIGSYLDFNSEGTHDIIFRTGANLGSGDSGSDRLLISSNGSLRVFGLDNLYEPDIQVNNSNSLISLGAGKNGPHGFLFGDDSGGGLQLLYRSSPNALILEKANDGSDGSDLFSVDFDTEYAYFKGNLGIGTTTPSYKLEVNGTIRSQEVKVEASPWPDYVFEPDYDLLTLEQTEAYIKENKHLPEIPSANAIEANGVELGEMNMLLLKKIEELTLHQIALQKELKELRLQNIQLANKVEKLESN